MTKSLHKHRIYISPAWRRYAEEVLGWILDEEGYLVGERE
jgi:hypothetical protein